jgi:hypothetical protein
VATHGKQNWVVVAKSMPGRGGKQCRERYTNKLAPDVKGGEWTEEEDALLFQKHRELGNKWAQIAVWVPGRSDNAVKNRFHSTVRRLQRDQLSQYKPGTKNSRWKKRPFPADMLEGIETDGPEKYGLSDPISVDKNVLTGSVSGPPPFSSSSSSSATTTTTKKRKQESTHEKEPTERSTRSAKKGKVAQATKETTPAKKNAAANSASPENEEDEKTATSSGGIGDVAMSKEALQEAAPTVASVTAAKALRSAANMGSFDEYEDEKESDGGGVSGGGSGGAVDDGEITSSVAVAGAMTAAVVVLTPTREDGPPEAQRSGPPSQWRKKKKKKQADKNNLQNAIAPTLRRGRSASGGGEGSHSGGVNMILPP